MDDGAGVRGLMDKTVKRSLAVGLLLGGFSLSVMAAPSIASVFRSVPKTPDRYAVSYSGVCEDYRFQIDLKHRQVTDEPYRSATEPVSGSLTYKSAAPIDLSALLSLGDGEKIVTVLPGCGTTSMTDQDSFSLRLIVKVTGTLGENDRYRFYSRELFFVENTLEIENTQPLELNDIGAMVD